LVLSATKAIVGGKYVRAADRLELLKPPYAAVKQQEQTPRTSVKVHETLLADDGKTLVLKTDPLPWNCGYSVAVAGVKAVGSAGTGTTVDVDFRLNGVDAEWFSKGSTYVCQPHLSTAVNERAARPLGPRLLRPAPVDLPGLGRVSFGRIFLRTSLDLPGRSRVVHLSSSAPFSAQLGSREGTAAGSGGEFAVNLTCDGTAPVPLLVSFPSDDPTRSFEASYHTDEDATERPIPFERLILPWAVDLPPAPDAAVAHKPVGDWARGKALFYGEAQCSTCHTVRGQGGTVGPDLSNLTFKDPDAVLNDVLNPSAAINPDYVSYIVKLKNGDVLAGLVAGEGDNFRITEGVDKVTTVRRADVQSLSPSPTSIMPDGFKALGDEKLHDVLEFLTGEQPKPPPGAK
jgi:putative heme-binding domain-containing protein